jgi:hypothetical protein
MTGARPHDQARTDDSGGSLSILPARLRFAQRLKGAVEPWIGVQRPDCLSHGIVALIDRERGGLVGGLVVARVGRDGRDEDVLAHVALQHAGGVAHPDR